VNKAAPPPPYALEEDVERAVVLAECGEPRFHSAIGRAMDPDRMRSPEARMLMAAAHAIASKTGNPPSWPALAIQHLTTLSSKGKVTWDQVQACKDYLLEAMAQPLVHADELVASVLPIIQRVRHKEAIVDALDGYKNNASPADTAAAFEAVAKLGKTTGSVMRSIDDIVAQPQFFVDVDKDLLQFGIPELDEAIGGGMEKGSLSLLVGGSGAGKSMALAHVAVEALLLGHHVFYLTLELSEGRVAQRIARNLTDMTRREVRLDPAEARRRYAAVRAMPGAGRFLVGYAEPLVTSPADVRRLVEASARENPGFDPRVIVVDFLDKLRCNPKASLYEDMLACTDGLRSIAVDVDGWAFTASQSDRKSTNRPWLDLDAVADSMNKIRSADAVVAIGRTDDDKAADLIRFCVPKRREGEGAHTRVGPLAWDPERGRITVVSNRTYPW